MLVLGGIRNYGILRRSNIFCILTVAEQSWDAREKVPQEKSMRDGDAGKIGKVNRFITFHFPIPYGCITLLAVVLVALGTLAVSALALSGAILK
jgi:hypothetical protein